MSLLSETFHAYAAERYKARAALLEPLQAELEAGFTAIDNEDVAALVRSYLATMPLTDVYDTPFAVFESYARQAVELRTASPWCCDVPEDIFVHFVATPRVNNEPLVDSWPAFRSALAARIEGMSAHDAVLEVNYWCCETATYQTSDDRTLGPLGMLASGSGRCGEESTYLVTALRANGIPARQMYTPLWAHCDDNHAWVEAYVDGEWFYLGACEPEEELNRGWFTAASGRAMLVHTRLFSDFACDFERDHSILAREGSQVIVNQTAAYGPTTTLSVTVRDEAEKPVSGAYVRLMLVNSAAWGDIAHLITDEAGCTHIVIGEGTLRVVAATETCMADALINTGETNSIELMLHEAEVDDSAIWRDTDVHAPADHPAPSCPLTAEQIQRGRTRKHEADLQRGARVAGFVEAARKLAAEHGHANDDCLKYYEMAFANAPEVDRFLTMDDGADRAALLSTLTSKDFRDLTADVLEDHLMGARVVRDEAIAYLRAQGAGKAAEDLYVHYVLAPRIHFEQLSSFRGYFSAVFDTQTVAMFRENPLRIWKLICDRTEFAATEHVKKLSGSPRGAWLSCQGSPVTKHALFVAICRSCGIAARVNPADHAIEYYHGGRWAAVEHPEPTVEVSFASSAEPAPGYFQAWSIARLETIVTVAGTRALSFETLDFWGRAPEDGICTLEIPTGTYRLTTSTRLPNGDSQAAERYFTVGEHGVTSPIRLMLREPSAEQMLEDIALEPFTLADEAGAPVNPAAIATAHGTDTHPVVVSFLEPGMEPTEHLLNELREQAERVCEADLPLVFVISHAAQLEDPTLARTLPALEDASVTIAYDDFSELPEKLARRMFANPEKLPLTILACAEGETLRGVYATAGYNVGTVDLLLKLVTLV